MDRTLVIPGETFPAHESFMAEVLSKEVNHYSTVFLMRTRENLPTKTYWNRSPVYLIPYSSKNSLINLLVAYLCMDLRYAYLIPKIVLKEKINVIHVRDMTFPLFISLILKYTLRKKVIYQKSFPMEHPRLLAAKNSKRKLATLMVCSRHCEKFILHKLMPFCDAILPISKYMSDNLHRDYRIPYKKMYPFGMGYNFDQVPQSTRVHTDSPSIFKIIYVGTLGDHRQFDVLLHGIALATQQLDNVIFEFVGGSDTEVADMQKLATSLGIDGYCSFSGYIKRDQVYAKIADSHIGISWFGTAIQFVDASPTKMMEYLALGIPILAVDTVLMHKDLLQETEAGILCKVNAQDVADKLTQLVHNYATYKKNAEHCIKFMKENYSYSKMRTQYKILLDTL